MPDNIVLQKDALRKHYIKLRADLPDTEQSDGRIINAILAHPVYRDASLLLLYAAVRREIDLTPLFDRAIRNGKTVAYPRCERDHALAFCAVKAQSQLSCGKYGILTPSSDLPPLPTSSLAGALCIVPALAADKSGNRLGYGGGYYDRFLKKNPVVSLCAVREGFLPTVLPTEETDVPCHYVCTEKGVFPCV